MSTRIRAIPSSLSAKTAPTVAPASTAFDPAVKKVLGTRLKSNMFGYTLALAWIQVVLLSVGKLVGQDGVGLKTVIWTPVQPFTIFATAALWGGLALPVLLMHKTCLTAELTKGTSFAKTVQKAWARGDVRKTLATYTLSAFLATAAYVLLSKHLESVDPRLNIFVKSRKHPLYLNGRLLFLIMSQVTVACVQSVRNVGYGSFTFIWGHTKLAPETISPMLLVEAAVATVSVMLSLPVFFIARLALRISLQTPLVKMLFWWLTPFTAHFLRGSFSFVLLFKHLPLLWRAWCLSLLTSLMWNFCDAIFKEYVCQPVPIATADVLVSGITSPDDVFKHFAYADLTAEKFFAPNMSTAAMWPTLCRESLLLLGHHYQHLVRRGVAPLPIVAPPPVPKPVEITATPVKMVRQSVFKSDSPSRASQLIDNLAGDSNADLPESFAKMPDALAKRVSEASSVSLSRFKPAVPTPASVAATRHWYTRERQDRVAESLLPYRKLDLLVVNTLSTLVAASLTDDQLGVVQRDIPKILEAMCAFLDEIETYQRDLPSATNEEEEEERKKAVVMLVEQADGFREGIARVVKTFGTKLSAFKFPPRVARKLQGFLDYA
ncbi:hypothetical protein CYLTODRAFT_400625 [Cylindrobasidium torrendii FP15055 ss-10]|uniref:Nucleoporin protein Ndc1-Nup n=1 Tax=Cylindrobasidium torrendii FP15055 ss-10 TaxID=1314674 RepID=A0A0D7B4A9_9AGAR|nr:hypothetical protein CYLTODRAFT_400625 [Cylindrobasidium torrendii FP15055 ss-10]